MSRYKLEEHRSLKFTVKRSSNLNVKGSTETITTGQRELIELRLLLCEFPCEIISP